MVSWVMWLLVTLTVNLYQSTVLLYPTLPDHVSCQVLAMRADETNLSHRFFRTSHRLLTELSAHQKGKIIPIHSLNYP
mgnify:CR=1 FL=1